MASPNSGKQILHSVQDDKAFGGSAAGGSSCIYATGGSTCWVASGHIYATNWLKRPWRTGTSEHKPCRPRSARPRDDDLEDPYHAPASAFAVCAELVQATLTGPLDALAAVSAAP